MNRQGSTLTELILVCAVISMLMAVFVPALRASRQKAKAVVCTSNIRQIGFAMAIYHGKTASFPHSFKDSLIAPVGGYAGSHTHDRMGWWWFNYIGRFYDKRADQESLLSCPSKNLKDSELETNILCGNYGINQSVCKSDGPGNKVEFDGQPLKLTEVLRPSETLLIVDSGYALINWWHVTLDPPQPPNPTLIEDTSYVPGAKINSEKAIWAGQEYDAIGGRHPNRSVNVGFVDGHVETRKADELLVEKKQERYENRYPLWNPR